MVIEGLDPNGLATDRQPFPYVDRNCRPGKDVPYTLICTPISESLAISRVEYLENRILQALKDLLGPNAINPEVEIEPEGSLKLF
jgi:hypothetical protein